MTKLVLAYSQNNLLQSNTFKVASAGVTSSLGRQAGSAWVSPFPMAQLIRMSGTISSAEDFVQNPMNFPDVAPWYVT